MKNIWKNAIYFLSLIGLITFVSSCGSDEPTPPVGTDATYVTTSISVENDSNNDGSAIDGNITMVLGVNSVTISGIGDSWNLKPEGFTNKAYSFSEFNSLGWTSGSVSNDTEASTVVLVYDESLTNARVKGTQAVYTYTFAKQ